MTNIQHNKSELNNLGTTTHGQYVTSIYYIHTEILASNFDV